MHVDNRAQMSDPSSLVGAVISYKTVRLVDQLCSFVDRSDLLRNEPRVRHAIWSMVADGRFDDKTPRDDVMAFVFAVRYIADTIEPLLEGERPNLQAGAPSNAHKVIKGQLLEELKTNSTCVKLRNDTVFKTYVNRISNLLAVLKVDPFEIQDNTFVRTRMLEVLAAEYLLFKDSELPSSLMKSCAHRRSVFQVQELYKAAREHPELGSIAKTAARLVLVGSYKDLAAVAMQYQTILTEIKQMLNNTPELAEQARSIAGDVLSKVIPSVAHAEKRLVTLRKEAAQIARDSPKYKTIIGSLVAAAFPRKDWGIRDAINVYDKAYRQIGTAARTQGNRSLSPHGGAFDVLRGMHRSAGEYIDAHAKHQKEFNQFFPRESPYYGLRRTIIDALMSRRFTSATDVKDYLDSVSKDLDEKMEQSNHQFPKGPLLWALLRKKFTDVDSMLSAYATCVTDCRTRFQRLGINSDRYLKTAAKSLFLGVYRRVDKAVSALTRSIATVAKYLEQHPDECSKQGDLVVLVFTERKRLSSEASQVQ